MKNISFLLAAFLFCGCAAAPYPAKGAVVTGNIADCGLVPVQSNLRFVPKATPLAIGGTTIIDIARSCQTDTNGAFSKFLVGGYYWMYDDDAANPDQYIPLVVPTNDTNTYSLNYCISLATNMAKYAWVFLPAPSVSLPDNVLTNNCSGAILNVPQLFGAMLDTINSDNGAVSSDGSGSLTANGFSTPDGSSINGSGLDVGGPSGFVYFNDGSGIFSYNGQTFYNGQTRVFNGIGSGLTGLNFTAKATNTTVSVYGHVTNGVCTWTTTP